MKTAHDIIIRPIITEDSMARLANKAYTFQVADGSNKTEIRKAVEELFGVKVAKVNTVSMKSKTKRVGYHVGQTSEWKKAIVTLTEDSKTIVFFDSMM